jgi:RNA polymerase sporulation-specific sigma factor
MKENLLCGEISKILKVPKEEITLALEAKTPISSVEESLYSDNKTENSINILESLSTNQDEANNIINKIAINKVIDKLNPRDKQLILLRYYKDKTQADVAKILGISQVQVSRIEKKILNQMKLELV